MDENVLLDNYARNVLPHRLSGLEDVMKTNKEDKMEFKGWVQLLEAVIGLAEKDLKSRSKIISRDAEYFLNSEYCENMRDICRMWRSDNDASNLYI